jgi:hypothetical protein
MDRDDILKKLAAAGAYVLADELLRLADLDEGAAKAVNRLISSPAACLDAYRNFLRNVERIDDREDYFDWRETRALAMQIRDALLDLRAAELEPKQGVEMVVEFLEAGPSIIEFCDDSNAEISTLFMYDASELFIKVKVPGTALPTYDNQGSSHAA